MDFVQFFERVRIMGVRKIVYRWGKHKKVDKYVYGEEFASPR